MTSEERLTEIRDLLAQLLEQTRATARKHEEVMETHRAALASHREGQRFGVVMSVVLLAVLTVLMVKLFA